MSNLEASYKLILEELSKISDSDNFYFKPIIPKLSDLQLISLIILAEFKSIDSECQLFRDIKGFDIESKIERSVYNRRKRKLFPFMEEIRTKMVEKLNFFEKYFVVVCLWKFVKWPDLQEVKSVKKQIMHCLIKDFVLLKTCSLMVINFMQFAQ